MLRFAGKAVTALVVFGRRITSQATLNFEVLHTFTGQPFDGALPFTGPTPHGGLGSPPSYRYRVVFALKPPSVPGRAWTEVVVHSFRSTEGIWPEAGVAIGRDGTLYGTPNADPTASAPSTP